jgi:hypothetical protein
LAKGFSSTEANALRAYNKNPEAIKAAYGQEYSVGKYLGNQIKLFDKDMANIKKGIAQTEALSVIQVPELDQAESLLPHLPAVNAKRLVDFLKDQPFTNNKSLDPQINLLHEWGTRLEKQMSQDGSVPAELMYNWKKELQTATKYNNENTNLIEDKLKEAAYGARVLVENAANQAAQAGSKEAATFTGLMRKAASKLDTIDFIRDELGKNPSKWPEKGQRLMTTIFGKNEKLLQERMAQLDSDHGTSFLETARQMKYANQLGQGSPGWTSGSATGRSMYSSALGLGVGSLASFATGDSKYAGLGLSIGAIASSPKVASALLGASDNMTGFWRAMVSKPEVLQRLAGIMETRAARVGVQKSTGAIGGLLDSVAEGIGGKEWTTPAQSSKELAKIRVPLQIKTLAGQVYNSLVKDGPISAGSTVRVIADTPYFLGLVHYWDLYQKRMQAAATAVGLQKIQDDKGSISIKQ